MKHIIIALASLFLLPFAAAQQPSSDGLENWSKVFEVLSHPRCSNCHVGSDNRPRWSGPSYEKAYGIEEGGWRYHGMAVNGGLSRIGNLSTPCSTCHQVENSDVPHGPPGAHVWVLAPVEMEWFGKSSQEVCVRLKSPETNGGRSLGEVAAHIDEDELVHWGWEPGPGREPVPHGRKETVAYLQAWAAAGAPCPEGTFDLEAHLQAGEE